MVRGHRDSSPPNRITRDDKTDRPSDRLDPWQRHFRKRRRAGSSAAKQARAIIATFADPNLVDGDGIPMAAL